MEKGKGKLVDGFVPAGAMQESRPKGEIPLILLLKLLNQPLYSRSSAHLEQVNATQFIKPGLSWQWLLLR
jgi:E3 ubiquitin-protein ligase HUWE1